MLNLGVAILIILNFCASGISSQQCRSYQRLPGNCVSIKSCPPLFHVLTNNPNAAQLRSLQRLTCGFDSSDPKVCCPLSSIIQATNTDHTPAHPVSPLESNDQTTTIDPKAQTVPSGPSVQNIDRHNINLSTHPGFKHIPTIKECGIGLGHNRIIGGKNVSHGSYPWMARIGYKSPIPGHVDYHCGGTVISKRFILTAAHCVEGIEDEFTPISVRLGEHDVTTEEDCNTDIQLCSKAEDYKIQRIISHPEYSINSKQNDITLIMVDRDINFDTIFIRPVCLPFTKEYNFELRHLAAGTGIVAGFGRTKWNNAGGSTILQEVTIPIKSNEECQSIYNQRVKISESQLCAGGEQGKDSCGGDSGGPFMIAAPVNQVPRIFQLGIVSFGPTHCGIGGLPGVYARTSSYLKWILDTIDESLRSSNS